MPFLLPHIVAASSLHGAGAAGAAAAGTAMLEPFPLMLQLSQTILVPTLIGASIRGFIPGAVAAIDGRKKLLAYINAGLLASVPWVQISKTASQKMAIEPSAVAATALAAVGVHLLFLSVNTMGCR